MAKFRTNHNRQSSTAGSGKMIAKVGIFGALVTALYMVFQFFGGQVADTSVTDADDTYLAEQYYLPELPAGDQLVQHSAYALAYNEAHEQADWVAYVLRRDDLNRPWLDRVDNFRADPRVQQGSAEYYDYQGSGYDRGHLVPSADMAYDARLMDETFYMSNISPQARQFNQGIWRELEETTRDWARKFGQLYVVSGPILEREGKGVIGRDNDITVPAAYFKVLLDLDEPEQKAIAFILPNQVSFDPLYEYAVSIDEVEQATGFDLFPDLMPRELEDRLESSSNIDLWSFSKRRYDLRVKEWNDVD